MSRQYEKQIPVKLDSEQVAERSQEMAASAILAARVELEIEEVKDEARGKLKGLKEGLVEIRGTAEKAGIRAGRVG